HRVPQFVLQLFVDALHERTPKNLIEICLHGGRATVQFPVEIPTSPLHVFVGVVCEKNHNLSKETEVLTTQITTDWRDLAECRDSEPSLFFPVGTTGPAVEQIEAAIAICMSCSFREECLQYAWRPIRSLVSGVATPRTTVVASASAGW